MHTSGLDAASMSTMRHGDQFAIKFNLVNKLSGPTKGVNDCLMTVQVPLSGKSHATLLSAYAPTMTNPDSAKERF